LSKEKDFKSGNTDTATEHSSGKGVIMLQTPYRTTKRKSALRGRNTDLSNGQRGGEGSRQRRADANRMNHCEEEMISEGKRESRIGTHLGDLWEEGRGMRQ